MVIWSPNFNQKLSLHNDIMVKVEGGLAKKCLETTWLVVVLTPPCRVGLSCLPRAPLSLLCMFLFLSDRSLNSLFSVSLSLPSVPLWLQADCSVQATARVARVCRSSLSQAKHLHCSTGKISSCLSPLSP